MKISVVIPAYNRPSLLQEAINSVVSQSYANWELIVVDDGSNPPLSMSEVKTLLGNKGVFLRHDSSRGVARAKNAGLKKATGEIITILDDDDLLAERLA